MMNIDDVKRILILGAGTMGHQIGLLCAVRGYDVVIYDIRSDILHKAKQRVVALADRLMAKEGIPTDSKSKILDRIIFTDNRRKAAEDVDLVSESIPEDPTIKGELFRSFHELCPERTVFTTNTSMLVPSMFAGLTGRPENFLAFHFHDILQTNVVDIMPHPGTSGRTIRLVRAFAEKLGQIAILLKKENHGYVFNAMISDLLRSALTLAANQVAGIEDIDRAWMGVMHTPVGPFGIMDSVGLDTVWKISDNSAKFSNDPQLTHNAEFIKKYVDQGKLGLKSGTGFYSYPEPRFKQPDFIIKP